jgi:hypothetical protein
MRLSRLFVLALHPNTTIDRRGERRDGRAGGRERRGGKGGTDETVPDSPKQNRLERVQSNS